MRLNRAFPAVLAVSVAAPPAQAAMAVGDKLAPFALQDHTGKDLNLRSLGESKAVVVMFISTECPVSNAYNERMASLAREYQAKGIAFVGINSNRAEPVPDIAAHAARNGFPFPVLKDVGNVQADAFGAQVTPEAYVFDPSWVLRYHGRIDDDRRGTNVTSQDLRAALDALLAGREVPVKETKAFGCTIKRVSK